MRLIPIAKHLPLLIEILLLQSLTHGNWIKSSIDVFVSLVINSSPLKWIIGFDKPIDRKIVCPQLILEWRKSVLIPPFHSKFFVGRFFGSVTLNQWCANSTRNHMDFGPFSVSQRDRVRWKVECRWFRYTGAFNLYICWFTVILLSPSIRMDVFMLFLIAKRIRFCSILLLYVPKPLSHPTSKQNFRSFVSCSWYYSLEGKSFFILPRKHGNAIESRR